MNEEMKANTLGSGLLSKHVSVFLKLSNSVGIVLSSSSCYVIA